LNLVDGFITQYLLANDYEVDEFNPVINYTVNHWGWTGFWIYKALILPLLMSGVFFFFRGEKRLRIIKWSCIGFGVLVFYMTILFLIQILGVGHV
jgi:hypothetical protein